MINYSLALSRHYILCATRDIQFCFAIQIQRNEQSETKTQTKRRETYYKCTNSPAHVANLARGFRSPEHHHEESRRAQYTLADIRPPLLPHRGWIFHERIRQRKGGKDRRNRKKEGESDEGRKEGRRSKRSVESGGTRGIIRPSTPQTHLLLPLFSYPSRTLPRVTPLDHSRHSSYLLPSSALYLSLFSLYLSHSFDLVSRTSSLFNFTPCFDFTYRQMGLLTSFLQQQLCTQ